MGGFGGSKFLDASGGGKTVIEVCLEGVGVCLTLEIFGEIPQIYSKRCQRIRYTNDERCCCERLLRGQPRVADVRKVRDSGDLEQQEQNGTSKKPIAPSTHRLPLTASSSPLS